MASLLSGMLSWSHRSTLAAKQLDEDNKKFQRALDAEDALGDIVKELGHLADHVHLRKRIFIQESNRSREIDVIAVCQALYVVEVKNWAGKVWRNEANRWFQLPPVGGARALEYNDVLEECAFKARGLVRYLQKHGVDVPPGSVRPVVVFASDKVQLDPANLGKDPSVFTKSQFREIVEQRSAIHDTLTTVAPWFFAGATEITPPLRKRINALLQVAKTWDVVIMHNGERQQGDLRWIKLPEYTEWKHANDREQGLNVMRKDIKSATVSWSSSSWWGMVGAMWQGSAGVMNLELQHYVPLVRPKGKSAASSSSSGGNGKKGTKPPPKAAKATDASGSGSGSGDDKPPTVHVINFTTKSAHRAAVDVNHVVFHQAGQVGPTVFPLSEIASLILSEGGDTK